MSKQDAFVVFDLRFHGRESELSVFSNEFSSLEWTSKHIRRLPQMQSYGGTPCELTILAVSLAAKIFTIADILAKRLAEKRDSVVCIGRKEIALKGPWKPKEIADVLGVIARKTSEEEALKQIAKVKSAKTSQSRKRLVSLEKRIREYESLVQGFDDLPEKKSWQEKKAENYRKRLIELRREAENIRSFIDFLTS